jgi:predicted NAD/FAD-binding protein
VTKAESLNALACHDGALSLKILSCCPSLTQVHKGAWASWNFLGESGTSTDASSEAAVTVSYWLNRLQVGWGTQGEVTESVSLAAKLT